MKRMEKYLALGLVGMMAMSLTACGSKSEPAAAPDNAPAEEAVSADRYGECRSGYGSGAWNQH